jgi:hypothetical protein
MGTIFRKIERFSVFPGERRSAQDCSGEADAKMNKSTIKHDFSMIVADVP